MDANADEAATVRIDMWLWAARFYKTRSLAKQAIDNGQVEVNGQRPKASRLVRAGDALQLERGGERYEIEVRAVSASRGPARVAQALYAESEDSQRRRAEARAQRSAEAAGYRPPEGRPSKRARRLIRALGDIDTL